MGESTAQIVCIHGEYPDLLKLKTEQICAPDAKIIPRLLVSVAATVSHYHTSYSVAHLSLFPSYYYTSGPSPNMISRNVS